jgi:lysophospholipase L1-like esterase
MVPLVGNYLRQVLAADKRRYEIISIPSSSSLSWARDHGLRDAIYRYDPQVVLISLGSNELFDPNPDRRAAAIRQVVSETRDRPCLWIGPPAWKKDKGFLRVLQDNVGRCRYFDSARLDLERMADGRHPSWTGSHAWATAVWKVLGGTQPVPAGNVQPGSR